MESTLSGIFKAHILRMPTTWLLVYHDSILDSVLCHKDDGGEEIEPRIEPHPITMRVLHQCLER